MKIAMLSSTPCWLIVLIGLDDLESYVCPGIPSASILFIGSPPFETPSSFRGPQPQSTTSHLDSNSFVMKLEMCP
jgi:hypothetical protein